MAIVCFKEHNWSLSKEMLSKEMQAGLLATFLEITCPLKICFFLEITWPLKISFFLEITWSLKIIFSSRNCLAAQN